MKVTLFTSENLRHNYLINLLSHFCDELWVVQERKNIYPKKKNQNDQISDIIKTYFNKVVEAQTKIFKKKYEYKDNKNIKTLSILHDQLNNLSLSYLDNFLQSDIYVIFGCSFIKGDLVNFLIKQKTINIHAGVSPYYRGTDCNFWALYDNNPHLVGSTIHILSKGLDNGPILYHAMSDIKKNPFEYTMSTVKSAFHSVAERIKDGSIFEIKPVVQDKNREIRYSRKIEFNEKIVKEYFKKEINLNQTKFDNALLKEPFFFKS